MTALDGRAPRSAVMSVHTYDIPQAAQCKIGRLEARRGRRIAVDDAAVISWPETADRPTAWQASPIGAADVLSGAFWGLLFAHLFLIPLSYAEQPCIALGQSDETLAPLGLTAEHLAAVRALVTRGTSAVFALHSDEDLDRLATVLGCDDDKRIEIVLDSHQRHRLLVGFNAAVS